MIRIGKNFERTTALAPEEEFDGGCTASIVYHDVVLWLEILYYFTYSLTDGFWLKNIAFLEHYFCFGFFSSFFL
jgi:hypothetical protein